jgi:hypothetical protein
MHYKYAFCKKMKLVWTLHSLKLSPDKETAAAFMTQKQPFGLRDQLEGKKSMPRRCYPQTYLSLQYIQNGERGRKKQILQGVQGTTELRRGFAWIDQRDPPQST